MTVNISGTFTKENRESNGLESIHDELVEAGLDRHIVVGLVETKFVKRDVAAGGIDTPTVRFVSIEPLTGPAAAAARELLDAARQERTGQRVDPTLLDELATAELQPIGEAADELPGGRPEFTGE